MVVVYSSADEFEIRPEPDRLPGLDFVRLDEGKQAKSRLIPTSGPMTRTPRWLVCWLMARSVLTLARAMHRRLCWQTPKETSSASLPRSDAHSSFLGQVCRQACHAATPNRCPWSLGGGVTQLVNARIAERPDAPPEPPRQPR